MPENENSNVAVPEDEKDWKETSETGFSSPSNSNYSQEDEFAAGLPSWDLVPSATVIRRVKRTV